MDRQLLDVLDLVQDLKDDHVDLAEEVDDMDDDLLRIKDSLDGIEETLDVYFWTLARASLDGLFNTPGHMEDDMYRSMVTNRLIDLQYEYLVCVSLAGFLKSM